MVTKLYTRKIEYCLNCPNNSRQREKGKVYSTSKCRLTRLFIATGTKEIPTKDQENNVWRLPPIPDFCPLETVE
jgi:hypothetical protein